MLRSRVIKRSVTIGARRTSISIEDEFFRRLRLIAQHRRRSVPRLLKEIDLGRDSSNLSSAIRLFVLEHKGESELGTTALR